MDETKKPIAPPPAIPKPAAPAPTIPKPVAPTATAPAPTIPKPVAPAPAIPKPVAPATAAPTATASPEKEEKNILADQQSQEPVEDDKPFTQSLAFACIMILVFFPIGIFLLYKNGYKKEFGWAIKLLLFIVGVVILQMILE